MKNFVQRFLSRDFFLKILFIFVFLILFFLLENFTKDIHSYGKVNIILHKNISIEAWVADTVKKQEDGLSVVHSLKQDEAMLFPFQKSDFHAFWMKGMKFHIDIVWLDENKRVVSLKEDAKPEDYPRVYIPDKKARYVLEFHDGFVEKNNIRIGDHFDWAE